MANHADETDEQAGHGSSGEPPEAVIVARIRRGDRADTYRTRALVHGMLTQPATFVAGSLGAAIIADQTNLPEFAMQRFAAVPATLWRRYAPDEFFRSAFRADPPTAVAQAEALLADPLAELAPRSWAGLARRCLVAGRRDLAGRTLARCEELARRDPAKWSAERADLSWLRQWADPVLAADPHGAGPAGSAPTADGVSFGVLGYDSPERTPAEPALHEHVQTLAAMSHLVRHRGVRFGGAEELAGFAGALRQRIRPGDGVDSAGTVTLTPVSRDASVHQHLPADTWLLTCGSYEVERALPLHPDIRPIFVSVSIHRRLLSPEVREQLTRYAPIGCRDWTTVDLLTSAGIPAFFSGCVTAGISALFSEGRDPRPTVDTDADGDTEEHGDTKTGRAIHGSLVPGLDAALEWLEACRREDSPVVTEHAESYLAARAAGVRAELRPADPTDPRLNGLRDLTGPAADAMAIAQRELLEPIVSAILAGRPRSEVYQLWGRSGEPHVDAARRRRAALPPMPAPSFDLAETCVAIRAKAARGPRRTVNVAITFDANLRDQARVVVEAIATNTTASVHMWMLTRDHGRSDHDLMAALFPEVAFSWYPIDGVEYGRVASLLAHTTTSSLDRLLLPDLLPQLDRVIYQDIDALALGDLAELTAWDLGGAPLAAADATSTRSGFVNVYHAAGKLPERPELGYELIQRTHARHRFDFTGFNSGVMVLDLDRMRRDRFCERYVPYVERYGMADQQVLNCYTGPERAVLPGEWNARPTRELVTEAKMLHWVGAQKPWNEEYVLFQEVWQDYAARLAKRIRSGAAAPAELTGESDC